jgi:hypothetical protein
MNEVEWRNLEFVRLGGMGTLYSSRRLGTSVLRCEQAFASLRQLLLQFG